MSALKVASVDPGLEMTVKLEAEAEIETENEFNLMNTLEGRRRKNQPTGFRDHSQLYEKLSEKNLDLLELKKGFLQETTVLKSMLQKKELEVLTCQNKMNSMRVKLKQTNKDLNAQSERAEMYQMKWEKERARTSEMRRSSEKAQKQSEEWKRKLSLETTKTRDLQRDLERAQKKQFEKRSQRQMERQVQTQLQQQLERVERQRELYKTKHALLNEKYVTLQKENESTESAASRLKNRQDDLCIENSKLKAQVDYYKANQPGRESQAHRSRHATRQGTESSSPAPVILEDAVANEDNQRLKEQIARMKQELNACVAQLKEWKTRVEKPGKRQVLSSFEKERLKKLEALEVQTADTENQLSSLKVAMKQVSSEKEALTRTYNEVMNVCNELSNASVEASQKVQTGILILWKILTSFLQGMQEQQKVTEALVVLEKETTLLVNLISTIARHEEPDVTLLLGHDDNYFWSNNSEQSTGGAEANKKVVDLLCEVMISPSQLAGTRNDLYQFLDQSSTGSARPAVDEEVARSLQRLLQLTTIKKEQPRLETGTSKGSLPHVQALHNKVVKARTEIANKYAERIGSECITQ